MLLNCQQYLVFLISYFELYIIALCIGIHILLPSHEVAQLFLATNSGSFQFPDVVSGSRHPALFSYCLEMLVGIVHQGSGFTIKPNQTSDDVY